MPWLHMLLWGHTRLQQHRTASLLCRSFTRSLHCTPGGTALMVGASSGCCLSISGQLPQRPDPDRILPWACNLHHESDDGWAGLSVRVIAQGLAVTPSMNACHPLCLGSLSAVFDNTCIYPCAQEGLPCADSEGRKLSRTYSGPLPERPRSSASNASTGSDSQPNTPPFGAGMSRRGMTL